LIEETAFQSAQIEKRFPQSTVLDADLKLSNEIVRIVDLICVCFLFLMSLWSVFTETSIPRNLVSSNTGNRTVVFPCSFFRQGSLLSKVIDMNINEAFYILDTLQDMRFQRDQLVVNSPFIRSFTGVPILIENICVGCIALMSPEPRLNEYTSSDITSLLDFAGVISSLLNTRGQLHRFQKQDKLRERKLQSQKSDLVLNFAHNLRTSLSTLNLALDELGESSGATTNGTASESQSAMHTARTSCYQLYAMIEANIKRSSSESNVVDESALAASTQGLEYHQSKSISIASTSID
jgi:signal transduction histidine kinase